MSKTASPFALLVEHEERIGNTYKDLLDRAAQSNISYFLKLFYDSHNAVIGRLNSFSRGEDRKENQSEIESPLAISATDHLENEDEVDLNSLRSVLLYIAKTEADSVTEFEDFIIHTTDTEIREFLTRIKEEKEIIATKADHLYHDMIESKIS